VHPVGGRLPVLGEVDVHRVHADGRRLAQMVQRAVAGDAVQPRPHVDRPLVSEHRVEGGCEDLLQHVLRVLLGGEHVAAERQQPALVARHQRLEGVMIAPAHERDQPLVALQAQQRRLGMGARGAGVFEDGDFQEKRSAGRVSGGWNPPPGEKLL